MLSPSRFIFVMVLLIGILPSGAIESEYDRQIAAARMGHPETTLDYLEQRLQRNPRDRRALGDYIVVLGWAERHADAYALRDRIDARTAPYYVVTSLAASARKAGDLETSKRLYRTVLERDSSRLDAWIGLSLALADSGYPEPALIALQRHDSESLPRRDRQALLRAEADIFAAQQQYGDAADTLRKLIALDGDDNRARRDLAVVTNRMGAPTLAYEELQRVPNPTKTPEWAAIALDRDAALIRWSGIDAQDPKTRFVGVDRALAENAKLIDTLANADPPDPNAMRRAYYDRVLALRLRMRMQDAAALYQKVRNYYGDDTPPYVLVAAADAYLYMEQPETARDLYLRARKAGDEDPEASLGLFYAYLECEQYDEAYRLIDGLAAGTRKFDPAFKPMPPNPLYLRVRTVQGMSRSYGDQQAEAGRMLDELNRSAPFDSGLRAERAKWMGARGWHEAAADEFTMLKNEDPTAVAAQIGLAGTQLDLNQYRDAEASIAGLARDYPEEKDVQDLQRRWDLHNRRELKVDANWGRGAGAVLGNRDFGIEALLYSAPIAYDYRVFARAYEAEADFDGTDGYRRRIGAGLEYRSQHYTVTGMVNRSVTGDPDAAIGATLECRPDDYWRFTLNGDTSTDDIPLRARTQGVTARGIDGEVVYRWNESLQARVGLGAQDFSDGNQRRRWSLGLIDRLFTAPHYKLDADVALSGSTNSSLPTATYFNPRRDQSIDLTLINEWIASRRYRDSVINRLFISTGTYQQRGFGSDMTLGLRLEQERNWNQSVALRYGIGRSSHPYDGASEWRNYIYLNFDWLF